MTLSGTEPDAATGVPKGRMTEAKKLRALLISGSAVLLSGSALTSLINLAYNVALARFLGPSGFGHATAVYTLLTVTSAVTLAFQIISTKLVAKQESDSRRFAVYRTLHRAAWVCGLTIAFSFLIFQRTIAAYLQLPNRTLVVLLALGTAFYVPLGPRRGYIQAAFGFRSLAANLTLEGVVRLLGSLILIWMNFGVTGVIWANAAAVAAAYFAIAPKSAIALTSVVSLGETLLEVGHAMVFYSGQVIINNCDILLVKHFFDPGSAGLYSAVAMVGRVTFALSSAVVNGMFPIASGMRHEDRKNLSVISISLAIVLLLGSLFALCLRFAPAELWTLLFGSKFLLLAGSRLPGLLALYAMTTVIYSLSVVIISYEMSYKLANSSWLQLLFSGAVAAGICLFHSSLEQVIMIQLGLMILLTVVVALSFLADVLRRSTQSIASTQPRFQLLRALTEDDVIARFLRSEFEHEAYREYHQVFAEIILHPDLSNDSENQRRRDLLFLRHRSMWKELPSDTEWFEVSLQPSDCDNLQVFPRAQWLRLARGNFLLTNVVERIRSGKYPVAGAFAAKIARIGERISVEPGDLGTVVLIGVDEKRPLTILDGNHRSVAATLQGRLHDLQFVCGLSPRMTECCWYETSVLSLARYGQNLIRHLGTPPKVRLGAP